MDDIDILLGLIAFVGLCKLALDLYQIKLNQRRNHILMGNLEALADLKAAVSEVVTALDDLAAKLAGGADISADLVSLTASLRAAVAKDDPPPAPQP